VKVIFHGCEGGGNPSVGGVNVRVLPAGLIQTNAYLLTDPALGEAVLIDAPGDIWAKVGPILQAERCTLREIWLTHGHWDHTQGAAEVVRATGAKVLAHRADQALIETPEMMRAFLIPGITLEGVKVDRWIGGGERLRGAGSEAEVRHVPGHCPGNVLFYFAPAGLAFVGDALFRGNVGRTDLPGGDFPELERSIRGQIYTLPHETVVHPGHGGGTTVGEEKRDNPYVAA
jgi:glyoxylase-like metal-dependent hydrolase (beta-lactamase superfamily II)